MYRKARRARQVIDFKQRKIHDLCIANYPDLYKDENGDKRLMLLTLPFYSQFRGRPVGVVDNNKFESVPGQFVVWPQMLFHRGVEKSGGICGSTCGRRGRWASDVA